MPYSEEEKTGKDVKEPDFSRRYTARDYLQWTMDYMVELIRGKVYTMSPGTATNHEQVYSNLDVRIRPLFHKQNCRVFGPKLDVCLVKESEDFRDSQNIVQPDLCIICDERKFSKQGCVGAPEFVIEILSPTNASKDTNLKIPLYEEFGVKELWIVDYMDKTISPYILNKAGKFEAKRLYTPPQILQSFVFPELSIELEEVFQGIFEFDE